MNYDLVTPCANCPFRNDICPFITAARCRDILHANGGFPCHKTLDYATPTMKKDKTKGTQHCAGVLIILEREERPNQMMRIAERLGMYDRRKLRMDAPVYSTVRAAIKAHQKARP